MSHFDVGDSHVLALSLFMIYFILLFLGKPRCPLYKSTVLALGMCHCMAGEIWISASGTGLIFKKDLKYVDCFARHALVLFTMPI